MTHLPTVRHTEGELWARTELALLRTARFSPAAVGRFLGTSQRRAGDVHRERPELARRARHWTMLGAAAWLLLAAAGREPFRRRLAAGLGWWGAVAVMLDWHLGMFETAGGEPRNLGPADALTLTRAWLVPVMADGLRPVPITLVAATDLLDGIAARATAPTRAGRDLEGLVDSAALGATLLGARRRDELAPATTALEITRISAGFAYTLLVYFGRADAPDPAVTRAARATTPLRVAGLLVASRGHRRAGSVVLAGGSLLGLIAVARAAKRRAPDGRQSAGRTFTPCQKAT